MKNEIKHSSSGTGTKNSTGNTAVCSLVEFLFSKATNNKAATEIIPTTQHILDNYDLLTPAQKIISGSWS